MVLFFGRCLVLNLKTSDLVPKTPSQCRRGFSEKKTDGMLFVIAHRDLCKKKTIYRTVINENMVKATLTILTVLKRGNGPLSSFTILNRSQTLLNVLTVFECP